MKIVKGESVELESQQAWDRGRGMGCRSIPNITNLRVQLEKMEPSQKTEMEEPKWKKKCQKSMMSGEPEKEQFQKKDVVLCPMFLIDWVGRKEQYVKD